jgi:hypothetical protein
MNAWADVRVTHHSFTTAGLLEQLLKKDFCQRQKATSRLLIISSRLQSQANS